MEAFTREGATLANSDALTNAGLREVPAAAAAQGKTPDLIQRETKYFRDLSAVYTDSIRASDFKANIALLFLPLLMVPIMDAQEKGLSHIPLSVVLAPFLIAYFFLIMAIFPRYRKTDKSAFHLSRTAVASIFSPTRTMMQPSSMRSGTGLRCFRRSCGGKPSISASASGPV